jgi:hypothetical protein
MGVLSIPRNLCRIFFGTGPACCESATFWDESSESSGAERFLRLAGANEVSRRLDEVGRRRPVSTK